MKKIIILFLLFQSSFTVISGKEIKIKSQGIVDEISRAVEKVIDLEDAVFQGAITAEDDVTLDQKFIIKSYTNGDTTQLSDNADIYTGSDFSCDQNCDIDGNINAVDTITLGTGTDVSGDQNSGISTINLPSIQFDGDVPDAVKGLTSQGVLPEGDCTIGSGEYTLPAEVKNTITLSGQYYKFTGLLQSKGSAPYCTFKITQDATIIWVTDSINSGKYLVFDNYEGGSWHSFDIWVGSSSTDGNVNFAQYDKFCYDVETGTYNTSALAGLFKLHAKGSVELQQSAQGYIVVDCNKEIVNHQDGTIYGAYLSRDSTVHFDQEANFLFDEQLLDILSELNVADVSETEVKP